jgi:hypothetical protein
LNAITGVGEKVLVSVFESWANRLKRVIKHEGSIPLGKQKIKDTSSRLAEKTEGYELIDPRHPLNRT